MPDLGVYGPAGLHDTRTASYRRILIGGEYTYLAGGKTIDGSESRDTGNTGDLDTLRPGLLMGRITATGLYCPAFIGVLAAAYTSGATEITLSAADATELVRRVGSTGTLTITGPPTAAGTVAVTTNKAYTAVNTTTGVVTIADIGADKIAGSLVSVYNDGSHIPRTFVPDEGSWGIKVTDDGSDVDVDFPRVPIAGQVDFSQLLPSITDTSLIAWVKVQLNDTARCHFVFDDDF